eukprot:2554065-Rhodomonas_salina.1
MRRKREGGIKAESGSQSDGMEDTPSQSFAEVTEARAEQVQCSGTALRAMGDARWRFPPYAHATLCPVLTSHVPVLHSMYGARRVSGECLGLKVCMGGAARGSARYGTDVAWGVPPEWCASDVWRAAVTCPSCLQ